MGKLNLKKLAIASAIFASAFLPASAVLADGEGGSNTDAYFIWDCSGKPCYHHFNKLKSPEEGINYIKDTDSTDESGNGVNYKVGQKNADWVFASDFGDPTGKTSEYYIGDADKPDSHGLSIQSIAFGGGNNSIASNLDWNFQVVIHRSSYKAITVGDRADDYTYFPSIWDFNYNSNIDVSGTTVSNPATIMAYIKESTIKIKTSDILSMTPLNVSASAVTVSKSLEGFDVKFNSDYYDHVTFELKGADGKTYYVMIARTTLDVHDIIQQGVEPELLVGLMHPANTDGKDTYSLVATTVKKDGSKTTEVLSSGNFYYRVDKNEKVASNNKTIECGRNLVCSWYSVRLNNPRALTGVYLNVIKNGSSDTVYSGTFSGSNRGLFWNAETRKVTYD